MVDHAYDRVRWESEQLLGSKSQNVCWTCSNGQNYTSFLLKKDHWGPVRKGPICGDGMDIQRIQAEFALDVHKIQTGYGLSSIAP